MMKFMIFFKNSQILKFYKKRKENILIIISRHKYN
jgi:hypothetical protein